MRSYLNCIAVTGSLMICMYLVTGIDDTRNTASLVMRMISDGCVLAVTKSLERVR